MRPLNRGDRVEVLPGDTASFNGRRGEVTNEPVRVRGFFMVHLDGVGDYRTIAFDGKHLRKLSLLELIAEAAV